MRSKIEFLRKEIMRVGCKNNMGHIASSLSCLDILVALRYEKEFAADDLVFSKAHGCYGLYAIDADQGRIPKANWEEFKLPGCYGELGSLGHGLPIAVGRAFGRKLSFSKRHTFVIVGDGEMQEGSCWEALSFMRHQELKNITVVVDVNGLQAIDRVDEVLGGNLAHRFTGWGLPVVICSGHDYETLVKILARRPPVVLAITTKGKGFPAIENIAKFHYRVPDENEREYRG